MAKHQQQKNKDYRLPGDLEYQFISLQAKDQCEELMHYVYEVFDEILGVNSRRHDSDATPVLGTVTRINDLCVHVVTIAENAGLHVRFVGDNSDKSLALWKHVLAAAGRRVGTASHRFHWHALVVPKQRFNGDYIAEDIQVSDIIIEKADRTKFIVESRSTLQGTSSTACYPSFSEGSCEGYTFGAAARPVKRELRQLCNLLSTFWNRQWEVHKEANVREWRPDFLAPAVNDPFLRPPDHTGTQLIAPVWLASGLAVLASSKKLAQALTMFAEGLELRYGGHDSMALISFVSCIETLGMIMTVSKPSPCKECGNIDKSGERFRKVLEFVRNEADIKKLRESYGTRSKTAHDSELYADEDIGGPHHVSLLLGYWEFASTKVLPIQEAARDLLLQIFAGNLELPQECV